MPINYILIAESCGIGFIIEINSELEYSKKRLVRYFDLDFNASGNESDVSNEFQFLHKFKINELKPLNIQPEFMQSNGFDFVYVIKIEGDFVLSDFSQKWTEKRMD